MNKQFTKGVKMKVLYIFPVIIAGLLTAFETNNEAKNPCKAP